MDLLPAEPDRVIPGGGDLCDVARRRKRVRCALACSMGTPSVNGRRGLTSSGQQLDRGKGRAVDCGLVDSRELTLCKKLRSQPAREAYRRIVARFHNESFSLIAKDSGEERRTSTRVAWSGSSQRDPHTRVDPTSRSAPAVIPASQMKHLRSHDRKDERYGGNRRKQSIERRLPRGLEP